jgi:hypothetical protein
VGELNNEHVGFTIQEFLYFMGFEELCNGGEKGGLLLK